MKIFGYTIADVKIDLWTIVSVPAAIYLCWSGKVSWWTFLLIVLWSFNCYLPVKQKKDDHT